MKRTILRPIAFAAGLHAGRQLKRFLAAHRRTAQVQDRLLSELISRHAETAFGADHGFARLRTYADFASAVPVHTYESLRPYVQRVLEGQTDALLPPGEPVLMFSLTSGTTGRPKHIPVTASFLGDIRRGWNAFGVRLLQDHSEAWLRPILQVSSPMKEAVSPTGLPCGAISGLLAATQKRIVRRMYAAPREVMAIADPKAKSYTILRCAIGRDVSVITAANPSSTIKLIETGQEFAEQLIADVEAGQFHPPGPVDEQILRRLRFRPDRPLARRLREHLRRDRLLLPRHFWRVAVLANWTGGTLQLYLPRLRELFAGAAIRDIGLLASEGRLSVPLHDGTPAGVAEITSNFLEFIPAEQRRRDDSVLSSARLLRAHELEAGREYFLVLTNRAGLWRYNLDDRVRVVDRFGDSPVFEFLCRGVSTASITGEKITEHQVVEAMRLTCLRAGGRVERFVLQGRFAPTPYYELRLEQAPGLDCLQLAALLDEELAGLNLEYRSKRSSGRLGPIRLATLPPGALQQAELEDIRLRGGRTEQYKHQYLLTNVLPE